MVSMNMATRNHCSRPMARHLHGHNVCAEISPKALPRLNFQVKHSGKFGLKDDVHLHMCMRASRRYSDLWSCHQQREYGTAGGGLVKYLGSHILPSRIGVGSPRRAILPPRRAEKMFASSAYRTTLAQPYRRRSS